MDFQSLYINVDPKKIAFLKFIIEGYDGLATVSTLDSKQGHVRLVSPSARIEELLSLLGTLTDTCSLKNITR